MCNQAYSNFSKIFSLFIEETRIGLYESNGFSTRLLVWTVHE